MVDEEAFCTFVSGQQPHLQKHVGAHGREIWRLPSQWPSVWRCTMAEMGPRRLERDPRNLKIRKRGCQRKSKGVRLGGLSRWSRLLKNRNKRRARGVWAMVQRRLRGEVASGFNAAIVVATISYGIARNRKKSKRSFTPPREKSSLGPFVHMDGSLGWNPWTTREQKGKR